MWWHKQPILRGYVSEMDRFLKDFDRRPEASSLSRRAEESRYEIIGKLRDNPDLRVPASKIWDGF